MKKKKTIKRILIVATVYNLLVVALVMSVLLVSTAKYRSGLRGYTNFQIDRFDGVIFEDVVVSPQPLLKTANDAEPDLSDDDEADSSGGSPEIAPETPTSSTFPVFGTSGELKLSDCYPGMEVKEYEFIIANGRTATNHATVDIMYSFAIRTMNNVPLRYEIELVKSEKIAEDSIQQLTIPLDKVTAQQVPEKVPFEDPNDKPEVDTPWYEWEFLDSDKNTGKFKLYGDSYQIDHYKLKVSWPVYKTDGEIDSNDSFYMKEVEIINLIAKLESVNKSADPNYGFDSPLPEDWEWYPTYVGSRGTIVLDAAHADYVQEEGANQNIYDFDFRGLKQIETGGAYVYEFDVNNGNQFFTYDQNGNRIMPQTKRTLYYTVQTMIPYETATKNISFNLLMKKADGTFDKYISYESEYRLYCVSLARPDYGKYVVYTELEAEKYIQDLDALGDSKKAEDLEYEIYRVDKYKVATDEAEAEHIFALDNVSITVFDEKVFDRYSENVFQIQVASENAKTQLAALQNVYPNNPDRSYRENRLAYRFQIIVDSIDSDDAFEGPIDHPLWNRKTNEAENE